MMKKLLAVGIALVFAASCKKEEKCTVCTTHYPNTTGAGGYDKDSSFCGRTQAEIDTYKAQYTYVTKYSVYPDTAVLSANVVTECH